MKRRNMALIASLLAAIGGVSPVSAEPPNITVTFTKVDGHPANSGLPFLATPHWDIEIEWSTNVVAGLQELKYTDPDKDTVVTVLGAGCPGPTKHKATAHHLKPIESAQGADCDRPPSISRWRFMRLESGGRPQPLSIAVPKKNLSEKDLTWDVPAAVAIVGGVKITSNDTGSKIDTQIANQSGGPRVIRLRVDPPAELYIYDIEVHSQAAFVRTSYIAAIIALAVVLLVIALVAATRRGRRMQGMR